MEVGLIQSNLMRNCSFNLDSALSLGVWVHGIGTLAHGRLNLVLIFTWRLPTSGAFLKFNQKVNVSNIGTHTCKLTLHNSWV